MSTTSWPRRIIGPRRARTLGLVLGTAVFADRALPLAAQTIAITGATIYPVGAPRIDRGTIVVRDGKIVALGTDIPVPADARRVDGTGKVVTPGFFHAQSALGLGVGRAAVEQMDEEYTAIGGTQDNSHAGDISASFNVQAGLDPNAIAIAIARTGGITGALVLPTGGLIAGQAVAIRLGGGNTAMMVIASPAAMLADLSDRSRSAGGGSRAGALARLRDILLDAQELRRRSQAYRDNRIQPLAAPARDLEALWPVLDGTLPLYVRARRQSDIENAVALAKEFHLRLIIRGGTEGWRVAPLLAAAAVPVVVDSRDNIPSFDGLGARSDNAALLRGAGVSVILAGEDMGGEMNLRFEAGHAVRNGMRWEDALEAVTLAPSRAFGLGDRRGTLAPGRPADLVVWSGDPFEFSSAPELVMVDGHDVPLTSRMTELRERYRVLPPRP